VRKEISRKVRKEISRKVRKELALAAFKQLTHFSYLCPLTYLAPQQESPQ
jgi:hypothetical protein